MGDLLRSMHTRIGAPTAHARDVDRKIVLSALLISPCTVAGIILHLPAVKCCALDRLCPEKIALRKVTVIRIENGE